MNQKITVNGVELEIEAIRALLRADKKIEAIRFVHETSKSGLREAKDAVDQIEADHLENATAADTKTKNQYSNSVFNEPRKKVYGIYVVIGIVLVMTVCYFLMWKK